MTSAQHMPRINGSREEMLSDDEPDQPVLDDADREHIRSLRRKGYSVSDLADAYQLTTEAVLAILRER